MDPVVEVDEHLGATYITLSCQPVFETYVYDNGVSIGFGMAGDPVRIEVP